MNNIADKKNNSSSVRSRKRKRSAEDEADEKVAAKREKLEERYDILHEAWIEDPEEVASDLEDYTIYNMNDVLVEQEKIFLRKDPFGSNFLAATWSNEGTLLRKDAPISKWIPRLAYLESDIFPEEVFAEILTHCDPSTLAAMMRVSMSVNKMLSENQLIWRNLFYRRHWRLKHDIENDFIGTDPDVFVDKSNWANFIPDNQVDWFGEYKRNHINATIIKNTIEEIKFKLHRFVELFAAVKEGVTNPRVLEPGVTDEDIDDGIIIDGIPITNDLRELLKCCNGARFYIDKNIDDFHDGTLRILFPSLEKLSVGSYTSTHYEEFTETTDIPQERRTSAPNPTLVFNSSEMQSDSDECAFSDDDLEYDEALHLEDKQILNAQQILFNIIPKSRWKPNVPQQIYCPQTGSIDHFDDIADDFDPCDSYGSIVDYLQVVSDYLDFGHSARWLKFDDYVVGEYDDDDGSFLLWMTEIWKTGTSHGQTMTAFNWDRMVDVTLQDFSSAFTMVPRARKILYAAAQDFLIKVFTKAWSLETTDTLQPDTLIETAKQFIPCSDYWYDAVSGREYRVKEELPEAIDL